MKTATKSQMTNKAIQDEIRDINRELAAIMEGGQGGYSGMNSPERAIELKDRRRELTSELFNRPNNDQPSPPWPKPWPTSTGRWPA